MSESEKRVFSGLLWLVEVVMVQSNISYAEALEIAADVYYTSLVEARMTYDRTS